MISRLRPASHATVETRIVSDEYRVSDLLRLPGYMVDGETRETEDGRLIVPVRTTHPRYRKCCLLQNLVKTGTKRPQYRDFTLQAQAVWLEVKRQRCVCRQCSAVVYEDLPSLDADFRTTERFREHLAKQAIAMPFTRAAEQNGVHETLVRRVFAQHASELLTFYEPVMPRVLGMDEIYLHRQPRFVIGDVEARVMIDMQPSRRLIDLKDYFSRMTGRDSVEIVCQDMWSSYHQVTKAMFPNAVTVIDKYHVQRTANYAVEFVRRALNASMEKKQRISLKRRRTLLLARWNSMTAEAKDYCDRIFKAYPDLETAYRLKEQFYDIYDTPDRKTADAAVTQWLAGVPATFHRPFKPSMDALANWRPHILRYFDCRFTSAYIERLNGLIRSMDRAGTGYTFEVLRQKALLKHGVFSKPGPGYNPGVMYWDAPQEVLDAFPRLLGADVSTLTADLDAGTF